MISAELFLALFGLLLLGAAFSGSGASDAESQEPPTVTDDNGDYIVAGTDAAENLLGSEFADRLDGGGGNDVLMGVAGDDFLFGDDGDDTLQGGDGNDYLDGGPGFDVIDGGPGDDTLADLDSRDLGDDIVTLGEGADFASIFLEFDETVAGPLVLTDFNPDEDVLTFDYVVPFEGVTEPDDYPEATLQQNEDGTETTFLLDGTPIVIFQGLSPAQLTDPETGLIGPALKIGFINSPNGLPPGESLQISGSPYDDFIEGAGSADTILGGEGDDFLYSDGNVVLLGEEGDDTLPLGLDVQTADGGPGDDSILAFSGARFDAAAGGSTITLGPGADTFRLDIDGDATDPGGFTPFDPMVVTDFDPNEDIIQILYVPEAAETSGPLPQPDFTAQAVPGEDATNLLLNGVPVITLQGLTPDQVTDPVTGALVPAIETAAFLELDGNGLNGEGSDDGDQIIVSGADNTLRAGAGDDMIRDDGDRSAIDLGPGDDEVKTGPSADAVLTLGAGADLVKIGGDVPDDDTPLQITDFDPGEDVLVVEVDKPLLGPQELAVSLRAGTPAPLTEVLVNGQVYASLSGVTPEQLTDPVTGGISAAVTAVFV